MAEAEPELRDWWSRDAIILTRSCSGLSFSVLGGGRRLVKIGDFVQITRAPFFTATIVPVLLGTALAWHDGVVTSIYGKH